MAKNRKGEHGIADQEKMLGWAGSRSAQTKCQHCRAGLELEPIGDAKEREGKEQLATINEGGDERGRLQLATVGLTVTRQRVMDRLP